MNDFDYDVLQKKRTAAGARHMKRGSRSKRCSLPSDNLTPAQLKRRNGPVSTYKLDEPMRWDDFKAMPVDLQKQYLTNLVETYNVSIFKIADMLGVNTMTITRLRESLGITVKAKGGTRQENYEKWRRWEDEFLSRRKAVVDTPPEGFTVKPMLWNEYKLLLLNQKKQYLTWLSHDHSITLKMIADMFQVSTATVEGEFRRLGIQSGLGKRRLPMYKAKMRDDWWASFNKKEETEAQKTKINETPIPEPVKAKEEMDLYGVSAVFTGDFNMESVSRWLKDIPVPYTEKVMISIRIERLVAASGKGGDAV